MRWQWRGAMGALLLGLGCGAAADWQLDGAGSQLSIVSIKAGDIAEVHRFEKLSGTVTDDGRVDLHIDVASLATGIAIRDERMRERFFETERYPQARLTAEVPQAVLDTLAPGNSLTLSLTGQLSLKSVTLPVTLELLATGLEDEAVLVVNRSPVIIDAGRFGLADAVGDLREIAGLPSISLAVPVDAALRFERREPAAEKPAGDR